MIGTLLRLTLLMGAWWGSSHGTLLGAGPARPDPEIDPAKDLPRIAPVEPPAALATWRVRPGFKLQLAAHEPQVRSPIALSFDERGRMYVCEMVDYSEQRDVTPHLGRISRLEDRDGDGHFETSTAFAENLAWPTAVIWASGGVYVVATPDLLFFKDTDDDGKADVREVVYTGFAGGLSRLNVQTLTNSATWGLDNRIHLQTGGGNRGVITCPSRPDLPGLELGGQDFWFDPRTREFGLQAGGAQYGMSFDPWGRRLACSNSDHLQLYVYDDTLVAPNPAFSLPSPRTSIAADGPAAEVFRISPDEPWRIVRTRWRVGGVVSGLVEGGGRVSGYFTGATGTTVYRGDAYGADFPLSTFTGDAGGQLVHRKLITPDGVGLVGRRAPDEADREFAASTDPWVRVVNFANAPDGTLYFCDMYREVIEHPWSIPEAIKRHLDLTSGRTRGRLYRIIPDTPGWTRRPAVALDRATPSELVATLSHANGWHRDTATRLLVERQDARAIEPLRRLAQTGAAPLGRVHAIAALEGLRALDAASLSAALRHPEARVRERGLTAVLRQARSGKNGVTPAGLTADVQAGIEACAGDADPRVRFYAGLAAPRLDRAARDRVLTRLARSDSGDRWISATVIHGADAELFFALEKDLVSLAPAWVGTLIETLAASQPSTELQAALRAFVLKGRPRVAWLQALDQGLRRSGSSLLAGPEAKAQFEPMFERAAGTAVDETRSDAARTESLELLGLTPWKLAQGPAGRGMQAGASEAVQVAAVRLAARFSEPEAARLMLVRWSELSRPARAAALTHLLSHPERTAALLSAWESGGLTAADLPAAERETLWNHADAALRERARRLLESTRPASPERVLASFQPSLGLTGDRTRGGTVFDQRCAICHRADGRGQWVGPDLVTVRSRGREGILTAIVDPHREVTPAYVAYTVFSKEGATLLGLISRDDASGVALTLMGGTQVTLARSAIAGTSSEGKSLMPEGLEAGLSLQAMADLLAFIEGLER